MHQGLHLQQALKFQEVQSLLVLKLKHQGSNLLEWQEALTLREAHLLGEEHEEHQGEGLEEEHGEEVEEE